MYIKRCVAALAASLLLQSAWALAPNLIEASNTIHAAQPQSVFSHHNHEITCLPGFSGELPTRHFGGYITVDKKHGRHLYYYMVEAEGNPADKPVVLWLNGGPGCSSFDGFMFEHGPFYFNFTDTSYNKLQLNLNPYSWHKAATMIYLDSPSPVGLSYSATPADYTTNDTATAADTNTFLRQFFQRYPHLQQRDFYISGESYAGVYVPSLAQEVVRGNGRGQKPHIRIKGYMVGNAVTDAWFDGAAYPPFAVGKSLISTDLYNSIQQACSPESSLSVCGPTPGMAARLARHSKHNGKECDNLLQEMQNELSELNIYNVLEDCHYKPRPSPSLGAVRKLQAAARRGRPLFADAAAARKGWNQWPVRGGVAQGSRVHNWAHLLHLDPPCTTASEGDLWLNDPHVRAALHAAPVAVTGPWMLCSDRIDYTHDMGSMIPIHEELTAKHGLRALVFSGDHDLCVPHTGSEAWTRSLGRPVVSQWQPWHIGKPKQVAGYTVEYDQGLTYATVKGAGHMVPQTRPAEALALFERFVSGEPLTSSS